MKHRCKQPAQQQDHLSIILFTNSTSASPCQLAPTSTPAHIHPPARHSSSVSPAAPSSSCSTSACWVALMAPALPAAVAPCAMVVITSFSACVVMGGVVRQALSKARGEARDKCRSTRSAFKARPTYHNHTTALFQPPPHLEQLVQLLGRVGLCVHVLQQQRQVCAQVARRHAAQRHARALRNQLCVEWKGWSRVEGNERGLRVDGRWGGAHGQCRQHNSRRHNSRRTVSQTMHTACAACAAHPG